MPKIFISVDALEEKTASGVAAVSGEIVTFVELDKTAYLSPAVYFSRVAGGDPDVLRLVGRVKSEVELRALGADHQANSVIIGETAYDVVEGFVGKVLS
ncbi:MAG: hypothetical protein IPL79_06550 [Myxococcales bacterium]|nr:hypothetical protein [Myxococcales bacterium]